MCNVWLDVGFRSNHSPLVLDSLCGPLLVTLLWTLISLLCDLVIAFDCVNWAVKEHFETLYFLKSAEIN